MEYRARYQDSIENGCLCGERPGGKIEDSLNLCAGGAAGYVVCDSGNVRGRARKGAAFQKADSK